MQRIRLSDRAGLAAGVLAAGLLSAAPAAGGELEDELRRRWVGRWVVTAVEAQSDCDGSYTNNRMLGARPVSSGHYRLAGGELGRIDNLHLRRSRIDLLIALDEPLRLSFRDGPFELFEQALCLIELRLPAPRSAVRRRQVEPLEELISTAVAGFDSRDEAAASPYASGRTVEPLPDGYEATLAAYRQFQAARLRDALADRLGTALDRAARLAAGAADDADYASGLAAGADDSEADRRVSGARCEELPATELYPRRGKAPDGLDEAAAERWLDGYRDGQRLMFEILLAQRLARCLY